ncbi:MAG: hypothetical protein ACE5LU_10435 [Anaerolineae bacterium]
MIVWSLIACTTPVPSGETGVHSGPRPVSEATVIPIPFPTPSVATTDPFAGFWRLIQQGLPRPAEAHQVLMDELLAYLQTLPQGINSLTDPEALARLPFRGPWRPQPDEREFRLIDLDGDGALELLVARVPPASIVRQTPQGFTAEDLPSSVSWPPDFSLPFIERVTDLTGDDRPEIVLTYLFGAGSYNGIELLVIGRENGSWAERLRVSLNTWAGGGQWRLEPLPDGTQTIVTTCAVLGVFDHKLLAHPMQRDTYRWNRERFVLAGSEQDPPAYRRQVINVAEAALRAGAYRAALATYQRLLDEPDLPDDPLERSTVTQDHPDWIAYATLRMGQLHALLRERAAALEILSQAEGAGSTVGRLARHFRETYQATGDPAAAWASMLSDTEIHEEQYYQRGNLVTFPGDAFGALYAGMALAATLNEQPDALDKGTEELRAAWRERDLEVKALLVTDLDGDGQAETVVVQPVAPPSSGVTSGEAAAWVLDRGPDGWFAARLQHFAGQGDVPLEGPLPVPGTQRQAVQMSSWVWSWDREQVIRYQDAQTWRVMEETAPASCNVRWQGQAVSQPAQMSLGSLLSSTGAAQSPEREPAEVSSGRRPVPWDVQLVGQIGGPIFAVAVQGNYAYVGVGPRLTVLDISDPSRPAVVGRSSVLSEIVKDVYVSGHYAYLVGWYTNLRVMDISDPTLPAEVSVFKTSGAAEAVYVAGQHAYVAAQTAGLRVIDVSDPTAPVEVGAYDTGGRSAHDVYVAGRYAYLVDWAGLQIADISDPAQPVQVGILDTPGLAQGVHVAGYYAYIAAEEAGLQIVDVSDPAAPTLVSTYDTPGRASNVRVAGSYAYVADSYAGLWIVDVSDPVAPVRVGAYYDPSGSLNYVVNVQIVGRHAYGVGGWDSSFQIVDVSDPTVPVEVGRYGALRSAVSLQVVGKYAYVADEPFGLRVINVSDPTAPAVAGSYETPGFAKDVHVAGHPSSSSGQVYAYIADGRSGLRIVDVSNVDDMAEVSAEESAWYVSRVLVQDRYAYLAGGYSDTLRVVDISDPTAPVTVGVYDEQGAAHDIFVADDYAYLAHEYRGLEILDVSDHAGLMKVGQHDLPGPTWAVDVADYYAYLTNEWSGLRIFDVSNPALPIAVSAYQPDAPAKFQDVFVARAPSDSGKDYAYVADSYRGLRVIDVSDPNAPVAAGFYPGGVVGVHIAGDYVYAAAQAGGLLILRFTPGLTQWVYLPLVFR